MGSISTPPIPAASIVSNCRVSPALSTALPGQYQRVQGLFSCVTSGQSSVGSRVEAPPEGKSPCGEGVAPQPHAKRPASRSQPRQIARERECIFSETILPRDEEHAFLRNLTLIFAREKIVIPKKERYFESAKFGAVRDHFRVGISKTGVLRQECFRSIAGSSHRAI